ncbi:hypothetical protein LG634_27480 [Streptomyces bambusae]|uniref:hypothetical protein n=1 Tax=Streptomyces bambusae TaxID=1550616 RepID=UPI001CFF11B1|nr:hypothetical protein [Streptomyces bambusae]MCB5168553.1 hypothetical protein [Streptomyces bambusae]
MKRHPLARRATGTRERHHTVHPAGPAADRAVPAGAHTTTEPQASRATRGAA